jgi:Holliday junction resolvase RusA-like endonuclease
VSAAEIRVNGIPAPQGSKKAIKRKDGGVSMVESSKAVGPWREAVRAETQRVMIAAMTGPVEVQIWFWLPRPTGHYRTGRNAHLFRDGAPKRPSGRPDADKLGRAILDGLTDGGAWKDDAQVTDLIIRKRYAAPGTMPGCTIWIGEIDQ